TKHEEDILESYKIIVKGKVFCVRAKELFVWNPTFKDIPEAVHCSDDESIKGEAEMNGRGFTLLILFLLSNVMDVTSHLLIVVGMASVLSMEARHSSFNSHRGLKQRGSFGSFSVYSIMESLHLSFLSLLLGGRESLWNRDWFLLLRFPTSILRQMTQAVIIMSRKRSASCIGISDFYCFWTAKVSCLFALETIKDIYVAHKFRVPITCSFRRPVRGGLEAQQLDHLMGLIESTLLSNFGRIGSTRSYSFSVRIFAKVKHLDSTSFILLDLLTEYQEDSYHLFFLLMLGERCDKG
ncbi:hypothetical protein Tco_1561012, partial [Tanacetum coccineum]